MFSDQTYLNRVSCYIFDFKLRARNLHWYSEGISCSCRSPGSILIMCVVFQAAVFMRSLDSLESRRLKARETMMKRGVAVLIVFWAMAGEAMDREGLGGPQCPQTLEGHTPNNEHCRLIVGSEWFLTTTMTHYKTALLFRLVPSLRYRQAWCCVLVVSQKFPAAGAGLQPLYCCAEKHWATQII